MINELDQFLVPELYDLFNKDCTSDVSWYIEYCKSRNFYRVLELGIGTGRVAIPMAQSGIEVWGVDNSSSMLSKLKSKVNHIGISNINIVFQDVCNMQIGQVFNIALVPFCTFNFLLSLEEQKLALQRLKAHLTNNAIVIFDLLTVNTFPHGNFANDFFFYREDKVGSKNIKMFIKNQFDQSSQIFSQNRLFKIYSPEGINTVNLIMKNRFFLLGEFELLLNSCGYKIAHIYGDYNQKPFDDKSSSLIVIAIKLGNG